MSVDLFCARDIFAALYSVGEKPEFSVNRSRFLWPLILAQTVLTTIHAEKMPHKDEQTSSWGKIKKSGSSF